MRASLLARSDADVKVVETFDGCIEKHGKREGNDRADWKEKNGFRILEKMLDSFNQWRATDIAGIGTFLTRFFGA